MLTGCNPSNNPTDFINQWLGGKINKIKKKDKTPQGFSITSSSTTSTTATIAWSESKKATKYRLLYRLSTSENFLTASPNATSPHTILGLTASKTYVLKVVAENEFGEAESSVTVVTGVANTTPVANNVTATLIEDTPQLLTLSYTDPGDTAVSCIILTTTNVIETTTCACTSGVCKVGIKGSPNFTGAASFTYRVTDSVGAISAPATGSVTITGVDDAPVVTAAAPASTPEDTPKIISFTYSDPEGDIASACEVSSLSNLSVTTPCSCDPVLQVCSVTVSGSPVNFNGTGAFQFRVLANGLYSNLGSATLVISAVNDAPTLTYVNTGLSGNKNEENAISFSALLALSDLADVDGPSVYFRITSTTGTLKKNGVTVSTLPVSFTNTDTITWKPVLNATGSIDAFTVKGYDGALESTADIQVPVFVIDVNHAPTLTSITALTGATEDVNYTVSYSQLTTNAVGLNDIDADTISFKLTEAPLNGTLYRGATPLTTGDVITSADTTLTWTPSAHKNGALNAFKLKATDGTADSTTAVQVVINTTAVADAPTISWVDILGPINEGDNLTMTFSELLPKSNLDDPDKFDTGYVDTRQFLVVSVISGTLTVNGAPVAAGTPIAAGSTLEWTPDPLANGLIDAFELRGSDGGLNSSGSVIVQIAVDSVNNPPVITSMADLSGTEDTIVNISHADLISKAAGEGDPDGTPNPVHFKITGIINGVLKKGATVLGVNDVIVDGDNLTWTPPLNADTLVPAFKLRAFDGMAVSSTEVTANVSLSPVNDAPVIDFINELPGAVNNVDFTISYDDLDLSVNSYVDPDGPSRRYRLESVSAGASLLINGTPFIPGVSEFTELDTLTWSPPPGVWGSLAAFKVRAVDGDVGGIALAEQIVTVNVSFYNHAPTLSSINDLTTPEDVNLNVDFAILFANAVGFGDIDTTDVVRFRVTSLVAGKINGADVSTFAGPLEINAGDTFVWTPPADTTGIVDAFYVESYDGSKHSDPVLVKVNVTDLDDAPTISTIADLTISEDSSETITLEDFRLTSDINDVDTAFASLGFRITDISAGWVLSKAIGEDFLPGETLTIAPPAGISGDDIEGFKVKAFDGNSLSASEVSVKVDITNVNNAPTINATGLLAGPASEDTDYDFTYTQLKTVTGAADVDGDPIELCITTIDPKLTLKIVGGADLNVGDCIVSGQSVRWRGLLNENGSLPIFKVRAFDGNTYSAYSTTQSQVSVIVSAVNDVPTLLSEATFSGVEDSSVTISYAALYAALNVSDVDHTSAAHSIRIDSVLGGWSSSIAAGASFSSGNITLTPPALTDGLFSVLTVRAYDGVGYSTTATVKISLSAVDHAPTAGPFTPQTIPEDTLTADITLPFTDVDGDAPTSCSVSALTNLTTTACTCAGATCTLKVQGTANYFGAASFQYTITTTGISGPMTSTPATASFTITNVNDAPVIADTLSNISALSDTAIAPVIFGIQDVDNTLTCTGNVTASSSNTSIVSNAGLVIGGTFPNCSLTISSVASAVGTTTVTVTLTDGSLTDVETFTVTLNPPAPATPSNFAVIAGSSVINLSWDAMVWATAPYSGGYTVQRSSDGGSTWANLAGCAAITATSCSDTTVVNGTAYSYKVRSYNVSGTSLFTSALSGKSIASFTPSLTITAAAKLDVSWAAVAGAETYDISWGTGGSPTGTSVTGVTSPYVISGLTPGVAYTVRVTAKNAVGATNTVHGTNVTGTPLGTFSITSAVGGNAKVTLGWSASAGATSASSYDVVCAPASPPPTALDYTDCGTNLSTGAEVTHRVGVPLVNGTAYSFIVKAKNSTGSLLSSAVNATPSTMFARNWDFSSGMTFIGNPSSGGNAVEVTSGVARLKSPDQIDGDSASALDFGAGDMVGVDWDSINNVLKLENNGGCDGTSTACFPQPSRIFDNLMARWRFDGSVTPDYVEPGSSHGSGASITGGASYVAGRNGQGIYFDGTDDCVEIPNANAPKPSSSYTIAFWYRSPATLMTTTYQVLLQTSAGITPTSTWGGYTVFIQNSGGYLKFYTTARNTTTPFSNLIQMHQGTSLNLNTWVHIMITFNGSSTTNNLNLYLNGTLASTASVSGAPDFGTFNMKIGCGHTTGGANGYYTRGTIDELSIWNTVLSGGKQYLHQKNLLSLLYDTPAGTRSGYLESRIMEGGATPQPWTSLQWKTPLPVGKPIPTTTMESSTNYSGVTGVDVRSNLLTHLRFDNYTDVDANGTLSNGDSFTSFGSAVSTATLVKTLTSDQVIDASKFNKGIELNDSANASTTAYVTQDIDGTTLSEASVSLWFKPYELPTTTGAETNTSLKGLFQWNNAANDTFLPLRLGLKYDSTLGYSHVTFKLNHSSTDNTNSITPLQIEVGKWYHVLLTAKLNAGVTTWKLYVNGVQQGFINYTPTGINKILGNQTEATKIYIGSIGVLSAALPANNANFRGKIDDVGVWGRELTSAEVTHLYRRGVSNIKFQIRTCDDDLCDTESWRGPDGTSTSFFSELHNVTAQSVNPTGNLQPTSPNMNLTNFILGGTPNGVQNNRYFQYRAILETDTIIEAERPRLERVTIGPDHFTSISPSITGMLPVESATVTGIGPVGGVPTVDDFLEDTASCPGGVTYNIGVGPDDSSITWYWWNPGAGPAAWQSIPSEDPLKSSPKSALIAQQSTLPVGSGNKLFFRAFLNSNGTQPCEIDNVRLKALAP